MYDIGKWMFACMLALGTMVPASAVSVLDRWDAAADLQQKMDAAVAAGGTKAVARYLPLAEVVLASDDGLSIYYDRSAGRVYALVDGDAGIVQQDYEFSDGHRVPMSVRQNPYPWIRLKLGMYYNDLRQPEQALEEVDAGLKASARSLHGHGSNRLGLIYEKARALVLLRRTADALGAFDAGLNAAEDGTGTPAAVAQFWNGRGYVLRVLGRLDEAEADYRHALKVQPDNQAARRGLEVIATYRVMKSKSELSKLMPH